MKGKDGQVERGRGGKTLFYLTDFSTVATDSPLHIPMSALISIIRNGAQHERYLPSKIDLDLRKPMVEYRSLWPLTTMP